MTTRGDYSSLPGTVEALAAEAERALLEQGGSDHAQLLRAPETPQWPGGRPPHISRPGVTSW